MFNIKKYYEKENNYSKKTLKNNLLKINEIIDTTKNFNTETNKKEFYKYFNICSKKIIEFCKLEENLNEKFYENRSFNELKKENYDNYSEILPENYNKCYADPEYSFKLFGEYGKYLSFLYNLIRSCRHYAIYHKIFYIEKISYILIDFFESYNKKNSNIDDFKNIMKKGLKKDLSLTLSCSFKESYDENFLFLNNIIENSDLSNFKYLFKYGIYISDNTIKNAEFLLNYPKENISKIAKQVASCYLKGIERDNKNLSGRTNVNVYYPPGYELIIKELIKELKKIGFKAVLNLISPKINRQFNYDHRFDENSINLNEKSIEEFTCVYKNSAEENKDILRKTSGNIFFETFGEPAFSPISKNECFKLTNEQQELFRKRINNITNIIDSYISHQDTSYTIISFPTPEIGDKFNEIFESILEINMLDSDKYEEIQQKIIYSLEKGKFVHVKGKNNNRTDIMVKIKEIENENETNFINCGADVNIPVGEVFTSPVLKETNGILHFPEIFLNGLKYIDIEFEFKNGYIEKYNCKNFKNKDENLKYIKENLLKNQETLPIGEFAIGTNTLAFVTAKKYGILNIMPILIYEKSGPHFAIGDTCFLRSEDVKMCNFLDKKEMIAKDNERSLLRKEDVSKAYTNCHTDMTIPFNEIEFITVITKNNKKIDIIRDGIFVLEGTEELNIPFKNL